MKKKIIVISMALVMIASIAFAESQLFSKPLTDLTLDELTEAKQAIDMEILSRFEKIEGVVIEPGIYIAGEDFPAGSYYFEGVQGRYSANLYQYPSKEKTSGLGAIQEIHYVGEEVPKTGRMIFEDGNALKIASGPVVIHIYKGLMN